MQRFVKRSEPYQIAGYPDWLSALLYSRGVRTPEEAEAFLQPSFDALRDPFLLPGVTDAVQIIREIAARKGRAAVYGDYDVDGLCACVIMQEALEACGLETLVYIPDRQSEGYGLHAEAVRSLAGQAELLVTVDCGITATEEVALAKELGMRVILTDHHSPPDVLPDADAIINPLLDDYPFPGLCGAGTAWKLVWALCGEDFARGQLDLAALATIADMVPLLDENRAIASLGLAALSQTRRVGLKALMAEAGIPEGQRLSSDRVGYVLAPRLNAGGRLTTAQSALRLLQATDAAEAEELAQELGQLNRQRQAQQLVHTEAALELLGQEDLRQAHSIVVTSEGWNPGVIGLVAGKLAERYGLPSVVLTQVGEICQGSGRSASGIDLYAALHRCADLFERFGGHRAAAGLSLRCEHLPAFKQRFEQAVLAQLDGRPLIRELSYDAELAMEDVNLRSIERLSQLEPFGMGNPAPVFLLSDIEAQGARQVGQEGQHLKLSLRQGSELRDAIAFGMGESLERLPPRLDALVRLSQNRYQGRVSAQCQMQAFRAAGQAFRREDGRALMALLQDLAAAVSNKYLPKISLGLLLEPFGEVDGYRGSLLFCRSFETAEAMHRRYPDFAVEVGTVHDPLAGNCILYGASLSQVQTAYGTIIFCDGLAYEAEAAWAKALFPEARLMAAEPSDALCGMLDELRISVDALREAYVQLRSQGSLSLPPVQRRAVLLVLEELELISLDGEAHAMLPLRKCDPMDSALFRLINR